MHVEEPIRILLVDDHDLFRESLKYMLQRHRNLEVVGEAANGLQALELARQLMPDLILMDVRMPVCGGLDALRQLQTELPGINVVMLTVSEDDVDLFAAVKGGAKGYLLKTTKAAELIAALAYVARGGAVIYPSMALRLLSEFATIKVIRENHPDMVGPGLTPREKQILDLVARGLENKEIASTLVISESTVKSHLRNVMEKLHLHNRAHAAAYAVRSDVAHPTAE